MKQPNDSHFKHFYNWQRWLRDGLLTKKGRKPSEETVGDYSKMLLKYFSLHSKLSVHSMVDLWQTPTKRREKILNKCWPDSQRRMMYFAILSYTKYLIKAGVEPKEFASVFEEFTPPAQNPNPRRTYLAPEQKKAIFEFMDTHQYFGEDNTARNKAVLGMLAYTPLRNSEICNLELDKVNFETNEFLYLAKGNEWAYMAIADPLKELLLEWLKHRPQSKYPQLFLNMAGKPFHRTSLASKIRFLRKHFDGMDITPHGFRAAFITDALQAGHPLPLVSKLANHKQLTTTNMYNRTQNRQAVDAMKTWKF